ncbi:MAG: ABC transporter transmembrane domain-containing protein, partial [Candidatus Hodarchaeales archaeon]
MHVVTESTKRLETIKLVERTRYRSGNHLFISFFWRKPLYIIFSLVMNVFAAGFNILPAVLLGGAIDILEVKGFGTEFLLLCGAIVIAGVFFLLSSFGANYTFAITAFAFERDIRQEFFDVIQEHSMTFHNEFNSSKLLSMGMTEISQMRMGLHPSMRILTQTFFSMIIMTFLLTSIQPVYGQIIMIGIPIYFIFAYRYARKIGPIRNQLANEIGMLTESCQEIFRGIEVVRGFTADEREKADFERKSHRYANLAQKEGRMQAFYIPGLILILITISIFSLGIFDLSNGIITSGSLIQAVTLLLTLQMLTFMTPMILLNIQASLINADRIWKTLN